MKPVVEETVTDLKKFTNTSRSMVIADLGCGSSPNAIALASMVVDAIFRHRGLDGQVPPELCAPSIDVAPKFEAKWLEEEDCAKKVKKAWSDALEAGARNVTERKDLVLRDLHEWDKNVLGELERRISKVKKELERCRRQMISQDCVSRENLLRYKLGRLR